MKEEVETESDSKVFSTDPVVEDMGANFDMIEAKVSREAKVNIITGCIFTVIGAYATKVGIYQLSGLDQLAVLGAGLMMTIAGAVGGIIKSGYILYTLRKREELRKRFIENMKKHPYVEAMRELYENIGKREEEQNKTPSV